MGSIRRGTGDGESGTALALAATGEGHTAVAARVVLRTRVVARRAACDRRLLGILTGALVARRAVGHRAPGLAAACDAVRARIVRATGTWAGERQCPRCGTWSPDDTCPECGGEEVAS